MTLNKQLLTVSLILLCLPWAGCQYLQEMNGIMRASQQQALMASSEAIAAVFSQRAELLYPHGQPAPKQTTASLYFTPLATSLWIDGYDKGLESVAPVRYRQPADDRQQLRLRSGIFKQQLLLFFEVADDEVIYNNPSKSLLNDGDRLVLVTAKGAYSLTTSAPGNVTARRLNTSAEAPRETAITAYWQDTDSGYNLELQLPVELAGSRLGIYLIDQDSQSVTRYGQLGSHDRLAPLFIYRPAALQQQLDIFQRPGLRLAILDPGHWILSDTGNLQAPSAPAGHWLIRRFYRLLLEFNRLHYPDYPDLFGNRKEIASALQGSASHAWYRERSRPNQRVLASTTPISRDGQVVLLAEQSSEQLTALSDDAFSRLLLLSFGAIGVVSVSLLGYASWLSWRIRRLSRAASNIVSDEGKLLGQFPTSQAADEVGELTRNYRQLLQRIGDYTAYLQTLSRKLTHELRTPLAIIHSSLDNLGNQPMDQQTALYQQRAKQGALRLGNILTAMSEASRVEASIENSDPEPVDINTFLTAVGRAYQDIYPDHRIKLQLECDPTADPLTLLAVPDLLAQMLDKLVDNAASFCPPGGNISILCQPHAKTIKLDIANDGPLLPETMRSQLFDNMVSLREESQQASHLGLGLHIVKLIVQSHNGSISAHNRADGSGVVFSIELPR